jgi:ketosteroid isomerase-like protein
VNSSPSNKAVLEKANAAMAAGDIEEFLSFCTENTEWTYVGGKTLRGKEAVRDYLKTSSDDPANFTVTHLIAESDFVVALGDITMKDDKGEMVRNSYCDVWRFDDGRMSKLTAFVIKTEAEGQD